MTNYEKQELLVALCGYLPNKLKIQTTCADDSIHELICAYFDDETGEYEFMDNCGLSWDIGDFKLYLRPLSSMRVGEILCLYKFFSGETCCLPEYTEEWGDFRTAIQNNKLYITSTCDGNKVKDGFDWLNKHHFDYRGLIERGFAIESPENLYNC